VCATCDDISAKGLGGGEDGPVDDPELSSEDEEMSMGATCDNVSAKELAGREDGPS
jgi:hypothetical protein